MMRLRKSLIIIFLWVATEARSMSVYKVCSEARKLYGELRVTRKHVALTILVAMCYLWHRSIKRQQEREKAHHRDWDVTPTLDERLTPLARHPKPAKLVKGAATIPLRRASDSSLDAKRGASVGSLVASNRALSDSELKKITMRERLKKLVAERERILKELANDRDNKVPVPDPREFAAKYREIEALRMETK